MSPTTGLDGNAGVALTFPGALRFDDGMPAYPAKRSCFVKKHVDRKCLGPVRSGPFSFQHGAAFVDYGSLCNVHH